MSVKIPFSFLGKTICITKSVGARRTRGKKAARTTRKAHGAALKK